MKTFRGITPNYQRIYFFSISILLIFLLGSCQKEIFTNTEVKPHIEPNSLDRVDFSEVIATTPFNSVEKILENTNIVDAKYDINDFEIDTKNIKKTVKSNFLGYAFYAKKKTESNSNVFYNLVLYKTHDEWYKLILKFIKKYNQNNGKFIGYETIVLSNKNKQSKGSCGSIYTVEVFRCPAGHEDPNCPDCRNCWHTISSGMTDACEQFDANISTSGGGVGSGTGDAGGGGGTSTLTNYNDLINNFLNPNRATIYNQLSTVNKNKCFEVYSLTENAFMTYLAIQLFNTYPNLTVNQLMPFLQDEKIYTFLLMYDNDIQKYQLACEMINFSIQNNTTFTFDTTLNSSNLQNFNTFTDFKNFLNNRSNLGSDFQVIQQQNEKIVSTKFWIGAPFHGVKVNIKEKTNPYQITNVTTELFGVTLLADWKQSDYTVSVVGNIITIDVFGVSSIKLFIEGIGTIYHENQHFQIKIDKTTGNIISANIIP